MHTDLKRIAFKILHFFGMVLRFKVGATQSQAGTTVLKMRLVVKTQRPKMVTTCSITVPCICGWVRDSYCGERAIAITVTWTKHPVITPYSCFYKPYVPKNVDTDDGRIDFVCSYSFDFSLSRKKHTWRADNNRCHSTIIVFASDNGDCGNYLTAGFC